MNPAGNKPFWLIAGAVWCLLTPAARPADVTEVENRVPTDAIPVISGRLAASPVGTFRKLLEMSLAERDQFLNQYPAASRERILEKMQEYQILPVELRELRLQVTELRWYLLPLMKLPAAHRAEQLKLVPESCRELVAARLEQWEILPPSLKDEVLEYETTMQYFVGRNAGGHAVIQRQVVVEDVPEKERPALERKLARWQALPQIQRQQMYASFEQYFQLSEDEKKKTLDALSESQRQEAEKVLDPIQKWPRAQQARYVAAFRKFADMSPAERDWFMKNAGRWQKMPAAERQAWRDLVQQLSDLPIMPPGSLQPRPQSTAPGLPGPVRTNPTAAPLK